MRNDKFTLKIIFKKQLKPQVLKVTLKDAEIIIKRKEDIDYFLFTRFGRILIEYTRNDFNGVN